MAEVKDCWQANLIILGKLERGDMLAAAGNDGKLVRKTNWLTQATNKSETHNVTLFNDIKLVLDIAVEEIDKNSDDNSVLIEQYVKANKGLEILLSTYKSKGSKETELIGKLSLVLAQHMVTMENNNVKVILKPQELKKHAEQAIQFVNDCRIRSVNNNWGNSYFGEEYDKILFTLMVRAVSTQRIAKEYYMDSVNPATVKSLKTILIEIIRKPISRKEKKVLLGNELNKLMGVQVYSKKEDIKGIDWLLDKKNFIDPKKDITHIADDAETQRIKLAKRAIRYRFGNCLDKASVAAMHLAENTRSPIGIVQVNGVRRPGFYNHSWVLISEEADNLKKATLQCHNNDRPANGNYKHLFPYDTWVVDGWTRDWWQLRAWTNSMGNPRQLRVRTKIRKAIEMGAIGVSFCNEINGELKPLITWPPAGRQAGFRLRFAHLAKLDWDKTVDKTQQITFEAYQAGVTALKSVRGQLEQIFDSNLLRTTVDQNDPTPLLDGLHISGGNRLSQNSNSLRDSGLSSSSSGNSSFDDYRD